MTVAALSGCGGSIGPTPAPASAPVGDAERSAVFASPTGAFLCSLDAGVADCLWPRDTHGIRIPTRVCGPAADEGPELRPGHAAGWLCGTDVGVVGDPATPELAAGHTLTSGPTSCRGFGRGVRCTRTGGWFFLAPGRFASGRR